MLMLIAEDNYYALYSMLYYFIKGLDKKWINSLNFNCVKLVDENFKILFLVYKVYKNTENKDNSYIRSVSPWFRISEMSVVGITV